jgi:anti-sigma regulatory factor (Ser/Thr protein kinase)
VNFVADAPPPLAGAGAIHIAVNDASCLRPLRRMIAKFLADRPEDLRIDADLVATELVTNALEHASAPRSVTIGYSPGGSLEIAVTDGDPDTDPTPGRSRISTYRGRGLTIVDHLATWGVQRGMATKTIWAVMGRGRHPALA